MNSLKRLLDVLRPQIEAQVKAWGSCIPESGNMAPGDCLSEVTVMIRSKFRAYVQAVVDKLVENVSILHFIFLPQMRHYLEMVLSLSYLFWLCHTVSDAS